MEVCKRGRILVLLKTDLQIILNTVQVLNQIVYHRHCMTTYKYPKMKIKMQIYEFTDKKSRRTYANHHGMVWRNDKSMRTHFYFKLLFQIFTRMWLCVQANKLKGQTYDYKADYAITIKIFLHFLLHLIYLENSLWSVSCVLLKIYYWPCVCRMFYWYKIYVCLEKCTYTQFNINY